MKRIVIIMLAMMAGVAIGQTRKSSTTTDKAVVKDSLKIGARWIKAVVVDTAFSAIADNTIPSTRAVKKYIDSRPAGSTDTSALSNRINAKLNRGDTATLSNRIDIKLNRNDTTTLSNRINVKLDRADTATLSNRINAKQNTLTAGANVTISGGVISATGGGGTVDEPTIAQLGFVTNMATLKSSSLYTAGGISAIKQVKLLGYYTNNDGGGGDFIWNPTGTTIDSGVNIKPTAVSGAGRWERVVTTSYVPAQWFGAIDDYKKIKNVKVDVANSRIYQETSGFITYSFGGGYNWQFDGTNFFLRGLTQGEVYSYMGQLVGQRIFLTIGGEQYDLGTAAPFGPDYNYFGYAWAVTLTNPLGHKFIGWQSVSAVQTPNGSLVGLPLDASIMPGKMMTVEGGRLWSAYKSDSIELNIKITSINGNYAYFTNLDVGRGALHATSNIFGENATVFTESTDGIVGALAYQADRSLSHVQLGPKKTCILPPMSSRWAASAGYNGAHNIFVFQDGNSLEGNMVVEGRTDNTPTYGYSYGGSLPTPVTPPANPVIGQMHSEGLSTAAADGNSWRYTDGGWEYQRYLSIFSHKTNLFYFLPKFMQKSFITLKNLNIELPAITEVGSSMQLFRDVDADSYRHGMEVLIENVNVSCPSFNVTLLNSNGGGVYGVGGKILMTAGYTFKNCKFEGFGACFDYKSASDGLSANQLGAKYLKIYDSYFNGGTNNAMRQVNAAATYTKVGSEYFLDINKAGFTWWDYNEHSLYASPDNTIYKPFVRLRSGFVSTVNSVVKNVNGSLTIVMNQPAPTGTTNVNGECVIAFGDAVNQVASWYKGLGSINELGTEITAGSSTLTVWGMQDVAADVLAALAGKEIRVYNTWDDVRVAEIINPRRAKLRLNQTENTLNNTAMDVVIYYSNSSTGNNYGHYIYASANINFDFANMTVDGAGKLAMRISDNASLGRNPVKFNNVQFNDVTGKAAFNTLSNRWVPYYQIITHLTAINSSAIFNDNRIGGAYIDNTFVNSYITGPVVAKNATINYSGLGGGKSTIENCTGSIIMQHQINNALIDGASPNLDIKNSSINMKWRNGTFDINNSKVKIELDQNDPSVFNAAIGGLSGKVTNSEISEFQYSAPFATGSSEMKKWGAAITYINTSASSAVIAPAAANRATGYMSFAKGKYPLTVVDNYDVNTFAQKLPQIGYIDTYPVDWNSRILYLDSRYDEYDVQAIGVVNGFRISSPVRDWNFDYVNVTQALYKPGIKITIRNITGGTVYFGERIKPVTKRPRTAGEVMYFTYNGTDWVEDYREETAAIEPTYEGLLGEYVKNSSTSSILGWSYNGSAWLAISRSL